MINLFVWNHLRDRNLLSYILRRKYTEPFEPAFLTNWVAGANRTDVLFKGLPTDQVEGDIAVISPEDFAMLDLYHAIAEKIHMRVPATAKVMRFGRVIEIPVHVYVYGPQFQKIKGRLR